MRLSVSTHGHGPGSHGGNVYYESEVSLRDKVSIPKRLGFVDSTSDHDTTEGLADTRREVEDSGLSHLYQIEMSLPFHMIVTAPFEVVSGIEKIYDLRTVQKRNKRWFKQGRYDGIASDVNKMIDSIVQGNDKVVVTFPHPFDTLKAGVASKMPVDQMLEILGNKNVHYVEVYNGMNNDRGNYLNATFGIVMSENYGKKMMVGADYHTAGMMGKNLNIVDARGSDEDSILKGLRDGVVGFENLGNMHTHDTMRWAINRVRMSKKDMLLKTYANDWIKESGWMEVLKYGPVKKAIAGSIKYADEHPDSMVWDLFTNLARGVNYMFETLQMNPKHRKVLMEATDGRVDRYEPLQYREFKKDPLSALEKIAVVPNSGRYCVH